MGGFGASTYRFVCALAQTALYCASVAARIRSKGLHCFCFVASCGVSLRRSKPKISFPSFFAFRRGVRGEPEKMEGTFLGLPARVRERGRGACQRNRGVRFGFKPPRTRRVRSQPLRGWKWVRAKVSMSAPEKSP